MRGCKNPNYVDCEEGSFSALGAREAKGICSTCKHELKPIEYVGDNPKILTVYADCRRYSKNDLRFVRLKGGGFFSDFMEVRNGVTIVVWIEKTVLRGVNQEFTVRV